MNKWKVAFFAITGLFIILITVIVVWATSPVEEDPIPAPDNNVAQTDSILLVETTADDFEKLAMKYLADSLNKSALPVDFVIGENIVLESELTVFGVTVPFSMEFDPIVNEDGNIRMKQTSMNVGKLNIPPITVLKLLSDSVEFPSWVIVRPNEEEIFVDLSRLRLYSGSKVRAKEIDLKNDRILLEIIVPNK
ncbi:YpmS family protein [Ureibacillus endophyticus]|uniref:DUF2140 family protein n=1 Tax=Ureibacillus endophyticus TaxID=1978490 RepID=A0A494Z724_9BACL|nr:YpmS family protein [Lysinibacillus endophyticus]RKQ18376.1 DUF2140 family protein [Lysinibacillus endophyticus]